MRNITVVSGQSVSVISGFASFNNLAFHVTSGAVISSLFGGVSVSGWGDPAVSGPMGWSGPESENQQTTDSFKEIYDGLQKEIGDYTLLYVRYIDEALMIAKSLREQGHWVQLTRANEETAAIYVAKWAKENEAEKGTPRFEKKEET